MSTHMFETMDGTPVPALTAAQMREVDRIAVDEYVLGILQMMENAGRSLAQNAVEMLGRPGGRVAVLAGPGGNGGGDLYLADIGIPPEVYRALGISFAPVFGERYWIELTRKPL